MTDVEIIGLLKTYVNKTLEGGGALKGKNCTIDSIDPISGGNRVTFKWTLDDGTVETGHLDVMNGLNGQDGEDGKDGKGIQSVSVNAENHLIITYTDGTTDDAGQIEIHSAVDSVNGQTGAVTLDAEDVGALPANTPIPSKTSDLTNDSGFITKAVNDLVNYYLKSETYSKTEVDDIVTAIKNSRFEVVATLPTTDIKTNVIYLVPKSTAQTSNVKDEYINLDGTTAGWEKIGDTEIDLSNYVTTQALNTALAAYTTTTDLTTLLAAKQDTLMFDDVPTENSNNPVKSGGVYADEKSIYEVMGQMGAKNLIYVEDFTLIKSSARTKSLTTEDFGNDIPKTQVTLSFEVSDSNLTVNGEFRAYAPLVSGAREFLGGVPYMADGTYSFSFDATNLDQLYIFINNEDETTATCKIGNVMIRFANDSDATYQPYAKTNQQLTQDKAEQAEVNDIVNVYGSKNLLPNNAVTKTVNGVTFTVNSDGSVTANGTSTAYTSLVIAQHGEASFFDDLIGKPIKLSGCPSGGASNTYKLRFDYASGNYVDDIGEGIIIIPQSTYSNTWYVEIGISGGVTVSNLTFYPMIRLASITDDTYVPYVPTNKELMSCKLNGYVGAKNLLPYPYYDTTRTESGLTITDNGDGTVKVNGTATATVRFRCTPTSATWPNNPILKKGIPYILTGCSEGAGEPQSAIYSITLYNSSDQVIGRDFGDGFVYIPSADEQLNSISIVIWTGAVCNNIVFKPMLRIALDSDSTWQPYAKTNKELTEAVDGMMMKVGRYTKTVKGTNTTYGALIDQICADMKTMIDGFADTNTKVIPMSITIDGLVTVFVRPDQYKKGDNFNIVAYCTSCDGTTFNTFYLRGLSGSGNSTIYRQDVTASSQAINDFTSTSFTGDKNISLIYDRYQII